MDSQPLVFSVKEQASETQLGSQARQVAVRPSSGGEWKIRTIGGVLTNSKGETMGLTVASLFDTGESSGMRVSAIRRPELDTAPSPTFSAGDVVASKNYVKQTRKWALVYFESHYRRPNIIRVPNGFGESFALIGLTKPDSVLNDEVWILTGRLGVVVGHGIEGVEWGVQLVNYSLTWSDCGSWAVHAASQTFLGIVERVVDSRVFLLPAEMIFEQIAGDLESVVQLPGVNSTPRDESETAPKASLSRRREESLWRMIFCCCLARESSTKEWKSSDDETGALVGKMGNQEIYGLSKTNQRKWRKIEVDIQQIIQQTPTQLTRESTPIVFLREFTMKDSPTAFIYCSSKSYAVQLQKAVRQSKVLDNSNFKIMAANAPILFDDDAPIQLSVRKSSRDVEASGMSTTLAEQHSL